MSSILKLLFFTVSLKAFPSKCLSVFPIDGSVLSHRQSLFTKKSWNYNYNYNFNYRRHFDYNHDVSLTNPTSCFRRRKIWSTPLKVASDKEMETEEEEYEEWQAGNLRLDLQHLRSAVAKANADTDLDQKERMHLLDEFARQRREVLPDVNKYVLRPLVAALVLMLTASVSVSVSSMSNGGGGGGAQFFNPMKIVKHQSRSFLRLMNASYYISMAVPLMMYHYAKKSQGSIKPEQIESLLDLENSDPNTDCSNYSFCLLENWASSIYPSAILQCLIMASCLYNNHILESKGVNLILSSFGISLSRLLTRLGAAASLHQFPKLLYELRRSNQPRPIESLPTRLNKVIDAYLWMLPMGFAADVAQMCLIPLQLKGFTNVHILPSQTTTPFIKMMYACLLISIVVPMAHIVALKRIFRIGQFTNVSLAMDQQKALELLNTKETDGFTLRYKLQWRPPIQIFNSGKLLLRRFTLFLFTGWGEKASIVDDNVASATNEPLILTMVGKEMEQQKTNPKFSDRSNWIREASASMANIHENNYRADTFDDPLGIAFQQTFGIGLSLDFDHDSKLRKDEVPSIHRLRARSAKSAIKQYNRIPQLVEEKVKHILDEEERGKEYKRLVERNRRKVMKVAMEISILMSTNAPSPDGKDLDVFSMKNSEANQLDSVSLPWLADTEEQTALYDPYLSFEDAYQYDLTRKKKEIEVSDNEDEDIFKTSKTILT